VFGDAGVFHQLFVTIGILLATVLGMKAVFGNASLWFLLYGLFVVPAGINFGMKSHSLVSISVAVLVC
jgi:hypothetical protein